MSETNKHVPVGAPHSSADCKAFTETLASVGDKWTILVIGALAKGKLRYNEVRRRVNGISQRMLTLTLKRLEADGLVCRTLLPSVPPRVDYELTELGFSLGGALEPLHVWAVQNKEAIVQNRLRATHGHSNSRLDK